MAMGRERSKPLHNFKLPCSLKWGNQKLLRCAKVDPTQRRSNGSQLIGRRKINDRRSNGVKETEVGFRSVVYGGDGGGGGGGGGDGIAAVREKLMFDLQAEADKIKYAIFRDGLEEEEEEEEEEVYPTPAPATVPASKVTEVAAAAAAEADGSRPWNLRTRRAACKEPMNGIATVGGGGGGGGGLEGNLKVDVNRTNGSSSSPLRTENKSARLRSEFAGAGKRATFSVSLSRNDIEEDFMEMVGHRPSRRPKKRAKLVQKNMDTLFPGLWLTEITPDLYKVHDDQ